MLRKSKVGLVAIIVVLSLGLISCSNSGAEKFPTKNITIMVGFGPGGGVDTAVRGIQPHLEKHLGKTVLVENVPGVEGVVAINDLVKSKPDGHTLLAFSSGMILTGAIYPDTLQFDGAVEDNLIPVYCWSNGEANGVFVANDSPYKTFEELVNAAKTKGVKVGLSGGISSTDGVVLLRLQKTFGGTWEGVPFDGGGEVASNLLGGYVDCGLSKTSSAALDTSRLRMLATALDERSERWPDSPTFAELGYEILTMPFSVGVVAPKDTPKEVVDILKNAFDKARNDEGYIKWAEETKQPIGTKGWDSAKYKQHLLDYADSVKELLPDIKAALDKAQGAK